MATPLIPVTLAWLIGIWLASRIAVSSVALGVAAIIAVASIILTWRRSPKPRWALILTLAAVLGALRYNLAPPHFGQTSPVAHNDQQQPVIVEGVAVAEPDVRDKYTNLRVQADKLSIANQPARTAKGLVLVQAPPFSDYRYGDRMRAQGKLQTPTKFESRSHLATPRADNTVVTVDNDIATLLSGPYAKLLLAVSRHLRCCP